MQHKKQSCFEIIAVLMITSGVCVGGYPVIATIYNDQRQAKAVAIQQDTVAEVDDDQKNEMLEDAQDYNERLNSLSVPLAQYKEIDGYDSALNVDGHGMMGYLTIPKINVEIPIYHGTENSALGSGAGHLEGSSLPIGGKGNRPVLCSHRGIPGLRLFTDLDQLDIGDMFSVTVLGKTTEYQVCDVSVIEPDDYESLKAHKDEDMVSLLTCTPYGINTQRLVVTGKRVIQNEDVISGKVDNNHPIRNKVTENTCNTVSFVTIVVTSAIIVSVLIVVEAWIFFKKR
ncbi:MAG: class C sortase [Bulleidia sp.]|nr:class C sortase [Bulleidia sp.]